MKFYFGLFLLLGGYVLFYWGTVNMIRWPGIDKGSSTGTDAPSMAMLMGFTQTVKVPHKIPFPLKATTASATSGTGWGQALGDTVNGIIQQQSSTKPTVGSINPLGSGGFAAGSPIPSGTDVQQGNYNIPGF
jgi:hypothetical protein